MNTTTTVAQCVETGRFDHTIVLYVADWYASAKHVTDARRHAITQLAPTVHSTAIGPRECLGWP